jgi:hypothetical protein
MIFTINSDNNITSFDTRAEATAAAVNDGGLTFETMGELTGLADSWTAGRLVEIYNSFTGVTPVKKFKDRETGLKRIWAFLNPEQPAEASTKTPARPKAAKVAKPKAKATTKATPAKKAPKAAKPAKEAKPATAKKGTKSEMVLALIRRPKGATLPEIMEAAGWQAHSVRGFIAGYVGKKLGLAVESTKSDKGQRTYRLGK